MDLTIVLTVGKYAILVALYAFVLVVFRGMMSQLVAESRREQRADAAARARRRRPSRERPAARAASEPRPSFRPEAEPAAPRPTVEVEAPPEVPQQPEPAVPEEPAPPAQRPSRIDLLGEEPRAGEAEVSEPAQAAHLLVLESGADDREDGERVPLSAAVTIGRSDENSLQIADRFISSRHALVRLQDGRRILMDRESKNGTFVNGERIEGEVELADGDRIAMGNTVLEYHR